MFSTLRNYSKYVIILIVIAMVITGGLYGYGTYMNRGAAQSSTNNIAVVNGTNITQEQYYNVLQQQAPRTNLGSSQVVPFRLDILEYLVERELIMQRGEELGIKPGITDQDVEDYLDTILENNEMTEDDLKTYLANQGSSLTQFKRSLKAGLEEGDILEQTRETTYSNLEVSENEVVQAYEKAAVKVIIKNFNDDQEKAREQIEEALSKIKEGAEFTAVAREYSDLKYNDGDLGNIGRENNFVPAAIVDRALEMDKGQLSPVIEEGEAFYLLKLEDKKTAAGEEYEEAKAGIKENLLIDKQNKAFSNWLNNVKAEAEIEIYDPVLRGYKALQNGNYAQAVSDFKELLTDNPTPMNYTYLAQAYSGTGEIEEAAATYDKAVGDYPDDWELHYNYAIFLAGIEEPDMEKAVSLLDKASQVSGEDLMAHYQLYLAYSQFNEEDRAKAEMEKVSEIQKKAQEAQQNAQEAADEAAADAPQTDDTVTDDESVTTDNTDTSSATEDK